MGNFWQILFKITPNSHPKSNLAGYLYIINYNFVTTEQIWKIQNLLQATFSGIRRDGYFLPPKWNRVIKFPNTIFVQFSLISTPAPLHLCILFFYLWVGKSLHGKPHEEFDILLTFSPRLTTFIRTSCRVTSIASLQLSLNWLKLLHVLTLSIRTNSMFCQLVDILYACWRYFLNQH